LKRTSTAIGFWFFNFTLEYLKRLQSSEPLHAKMNPNFCLFRSRFAKNLVFLLAGALLFDEKISQCAALFWFGLQDVGILCSCAVLQIIIDVSPAFLEHGLAEKIAVRAHANRDLNKQEVEFIFAWSGSELWTLIKYPRSKIKNKKPIAVDVHFKTYPMVPLSYRSNVAGRYL
jgi:hypothetical protein